MSTLRWICLMRPLPAAGGINMGTNLFSEPLHIRCVGRGETIIQAGPYAGLIKSDCGDGFEYLLERGTAAPK